MKYILTLILIIIILSFAACNTFSHTTLQEDEFYVYEDGEVFAEFEDFELSYFSFPTESHHEYIDKNLKTKRGVKIGSSVDDLQAYKNIIVLHNGEYISLGDYLEIRDEENGCKIFLISYVLDGEIYNAEEFACILEEKEITWADYQKNFNEIDKEFNIKSYELFFSVEDGVIKNIFVSK